MMACCLVGAKPLSEPVLKYCQLDPKEHISIKFYVKFKSFHWKKDISKCCLQNRSYFVSASIWTIWDSLPYGMSLANLSNSKYNRNMTIPQNQGHNHCTKMDTNDDVALTLNVRGTELFRFK